MPAWYHGQSLLGVLAARGRRVRRDAQHPRPLPAGMALADRAFPSRPAPPVARNALTPASRSVQRDDHARNRRGPLGQNRGELIPATESPGAAAPQPDRDSIRG